LSLFSVLSYYKTDQNGETLFAEKQYTLAADLLQSEFNKESEPSVKARKAFLIGECYRFSSQTTEAERWYKTAAEINRDPRSEFLYALMLKNNEKYKEASDAFTEYLKESPFDEEARSEVEACNLAQQWIAAKSNYQVTDIEAINSQAYDYAPVLYGKNGLVFTSDRSNASGSEIYGWTGEKFSDLYIAARDQNGNYNAPESFSEVLNSAFNEGAVSFNKDFSECYFTRCGSNQTVNDYCRIYYSYREGDSWTEPQALPIFNDSTNVSQPFLTDDGKELYVSSDADGGYGGKDLYVLTRTAEGWGSPLNLGPGINTPGDESFPYLDEAGKLYFASNGHLGMGGLDIFSGSHLKNQWGKCSEYEIPRQFRWR
jgi:tetratricopeptide (TPR) repeat protein